MVGLADAAGKRLDFRRKALEAARRRTPEQSPGTHHFPMLHGPIAVAIPTLLQHVLRHAFAARLGPRPERLRPRTQRGEAAVRSEEHTSELQSRLHLVC